jgi:hypothetical protein
MCALQSARPQRDYPCGQQDLYTVTETGWGSFAQHLPQFENLSTKYLAATGTDQLAAVAAARDLPDEDSRDEVHKTLRVQMKGLADNCLIKWSNMDTYIRDGFPEDEYENKRIAAGYNYYTSAAHDNWDDVKGLMQNGLLFLNANAAALTTPGGMPATFAVDFAAVKDAFELKYQAFLQAEEESKVLTDEKILANNALYQNLMKMFEDGKKIFREDAAVREQFTFDRVWSLVSGGSSGGTGIPATVIELGGYIYDMETGVPISGAQLTVFNAPGGVTISATSNPEGIVYMSIPGFKPNETVLIQGEMSADGYKSEMGDDEMTAGSFYSIDTGMQQLVLIE